jgi:hypothetical protein
MKKISILFFVFCSTILFAQEEVLLRLNYKKGDTYIMSMKMSQDMGSLANSKMTMEIKQEITETTKDDYSCSMKIENVKMDVIQGENIQSYDSSKKIEEDDVFGNQMKQALGGMLSANIVMKGNYLGEALDIKVEPNVPGMEEMMSSNESVVYPKEPIKVGSTWTMVKDKNGIKMNFNYLVKEINKEVILLTINGDASGVASGTISGTMKVDRNDGVPLNSKIEIILETAGQKVGTLVEMIAEKQ